MKEMDLAASYQEELDTIKKAIQESELLSKYLEEEEEEDYQGLRELFEPKMLAVYERIADTDPLQLIALEKAFLDEDFEGLLLPKLLGYSVLRGVVEKDTMKYQLPQNHFKNILLAICNSSNFDYLKKRIGQAIQIGFSLSSDIWVTNLINPISNKRIRYFLQGQKLDRYRDPRERITGLARFSRQFSNENFQSTIFPANRSELKILTNSLKNFLVYRVEKDKDNSTIIPEMNNLVLNADFHHTEEHLEFMILYANLMDINEPYLSNLKMVFNKIRKEDEDFCDKYLNYLLEILYSKITIDSKTDNRVSAILDKSVDDKLAKYYNLMDEVHSKGYNHDDAIASVKLFYNQYQGVSTINECVRRVIFSYFARVLNNLNVSEYPEMFELAKTFPAYMKIFSNEQFNQDVKGLCMKYVKKLLKHYVDKRGKDYQDIKRFVSTTFIELKFLKPKESVELFKTRRKKKPATS